VMVLGNFNYDNWKLSQVRVNLELNHILVAGNKFLQNFSKISKIINLP
jgi:hypothetical protein